MLILLYTHLTHFCGSLVFVLFDEVCFYFSFESSFYTAGRKLVEIKRARGTFYDNPIKEVDAKL